MDRFTAWLCPTTWWCRTQPRVGNQGPKKRLLQLDDVLTFLPPSENFEKADALLTRKDGRGVRGLGVAPWGIAGRESAANG